MEASCAVCDISSPHLRVCGQCHFVYYCSKYHQRNHWHIHEYHCPNLRELHYLRCQIPDNQITADNFILVLLKGDRLYKRIYSQVIMCLTHHYHLVTNYLDGYNLPPLSHVPTPTLVSHASSDTSVPFSNPQDLLDTTNYFTLEDKSYDDILFCYSPEATSLTIDQVEDRDIFHEGSWSGSSRSSRLPSLATRPIRGISRGSQTTGTTDSLSYYSDFGRDFLDEADSSLCNKSTQTYWFDGCCDGTRGSEYESFVRDTTNLEVDDEDDWEEDDSDHDADSICSEDPTFLLLNSSALHFASKHRVDWNETMEACAYLKLLSNKLLSHEYGIHDDLFNSLVGMNNFSNIHTVSSLLQSNRIVDGECYLSRLSGLDPEIAGHGDSAAVKYGVCLQILRSVFYDIHGEMQQTCASLRYAFSNIPSSISVNFAMILINLFVLVGRVHDYSPTSSKSRVALERSKCILSVLNGLQKEMITNEAINVLVACAECTLGHVLYERHEFTLAEERYGKAQATAASLFGFNFVTFHPQQCLYIDVTLSKIWMDLERNNIHRAICLFNTLNESFANSLGVYHAGSPLFGLVDRIKFTYHALSQYSRAYS